MIRKKFLEKLESFLRPDPNFGFELCKLGLIQAVWESKIERRNHSLRYLQEGRLRLLTEIHQDVLHGKFLLFYPDGKLWMRGVYRNGELITESLDIFMPDGSLLKPAPLPNNVISFPKK